MPRNNRGPYIYCDDTDEPVELPWRWEICSSCDGHGRSSAYLGAYTRSEMDEAGPDFEEDYMAGRYDRTCDECDGYGKVKVVDERRTDPKVLAEYRLQQQLDDEIDAEHEAERRFGC